MDEKLRLANLIGRLIDTKQDKQPFWGGLLGTYDASGNQIIRVPDRAGYVYVRLGASYNEVITAVNGVVSEVFDLKVIVTIHPANPGVFIIHGRDLNQYVNFATNNGQGASSYLPHHGDTHSFGSGVDPVYIYKRQMLQPLGAHPTNPTTNHLYVEPDFYIWKNQVKYFYGANTVDLTLAKPRDGINGRYLTVYLNGDTNALAYITGSDFTVWPFASTGSINSIIAPLPSIGIPLAAVLLTSGSSTVEWSTTKDVRNFLDGGGTQALIHPLDPSGGFHTGTLNAVNVIISDPGHYYTGTVNVDQAFQELGLKNVYPVQGTGTFGTGSAGYLAEWSDISHIRASTIQKTGVGVITITAASNYTLTLAGSLIIDSNIEIDGAGATNGQVLTYSSSLGKYTAQDSAGGSSSGGGHDHGVTRLSITTGTTTIPLLDFAYVIEYASYAGLVLDPTTYSISTGSDYLVLDSVLTGTGIFVTAYQILGL